MRLQFAALFYLSLLFGCGPGTADIRDLSVRDLSENELSDLLSRGL